MVDALTHTTCHCLNYICNSTAIQSDLWIPLEFLFKNSENDEKEKGISHG